MASRGAIVIALAAFAACAYKAPASSYPSQDHDAASQHALIGCLDVEVDRRTDHGCSAVVGYTFANRCDAPAVVDLAWGNVIGRTAEGAEIALLPYAATGELPILELAPRAIQAEAVHYPSPDPIAQLCIDVASLTQTRPHSPAFGGSLHRGPAQWLCFGNREAVAGI